jgi:hypothetical protein
MSFSEQWAMRHLKNPERGTFRVTGIQEGRSHTKITGIITTIGGVGPRRVEHKTDEPGRWAGVTEVPVLVDRVHPSRFVVLWHEMQAGADPTAAPPQFGPGAGVPLGPDGQPITAHMPPEIAARVQASINQKLAQLPPDKAARAQAALDRVFGQAGGPGPGLGQALGQAFGQAIRREFGLPGGSPDAPYAVPTGAPPFGQGGPAASGFPQVSWNDQGVPGSAAQGGPAASGFPQVSWNDQGVPGSAAQGGFNPAQPAQAPAGGGGEPASAIVVSAQDVAATPGFAAPGGVVDLTLEVRRADGSVYTAQTRVSVTTPERRAAVATPGTRLYVMIDPNDPSRVEIVA